MEDVKLMVKDCLGPLPKVCQEQVLLDMERSRMLAADGRGRLNQATEALRNSENQRRECEWILRDAMTILDQHLANEHMSDSSRNDLTSLYQFLWHVAQEFERVRNNILSISIPATAWLEGVSLILPALDATG